jgi:hypothetical protein
MNLINKEKLLKHIEYEKTNYADNWDFVFALVEDIKNDRFKPTAQDVFETIKEAFK